MTPDVDQAHGDRERRVRGVREAEKNLVDAAKLAHRRAVMPQLGD